MQSYDHQAIEKKWQKRWERAKLYQAEDFSKRPKYYLLIEFPYPSGERLHVGHGRSYCAFDALARFKRMQGYNVLFPFGWDAFGLPAENYAIRTGIHPSITTKKNIDNARVQAKSWGLSFDWSREINTTDPEYYKWTQWIFLQFFKKGLAYKAEVSVNWCPSCKINLANEEVIQGACERCGAPTERRMQKQWMLKITAYADRLLEDLKLVDYREDIKQQQINWIGRSEGIRICFPLATRIDVDSDAETRGIRVTPRLDPRGSAWVEVFTTRPDTLFGATFLVLAPEHLLVNKITSKEQRKRVEAYIRTALRKSELQRQEEIREKTGVFSGAYAQHPITGERLPIWISDFVLPSYGTGAIMAVPAHDQRDFEFAKKFKLLVKEVIKNKVESKFPSEAFTGEGTLVNSGEFSNLHSKEASAKVTTWLKKKGLGEPAVDYKLRDWVFSRQHYWGEPIPIIICKKCGYVPVPEKDLPVKLPYVENYKPTKTGKSPLAAIKSWVNIKCPECDGPAQRETDTMPNWAGSSWYFLRYTDSRNSKKFADRKKLEYWMPVNWYNGGLEHTTLHLLYSRFWYKFLFDLGLVPDPEPYQKRTSHGVVLGPDGYRMSKSRGNVVNPDEVVAKFGADTFRIYEMFLGPFDQMIAWDPQGVIGVHRFLAHVWKAHGVICKQPLDESDKKPKRKLHQLIKKVEEDLEKTKFNTAVAALMEFINQLTANSYQLTVGDWKIFLRVLAPLAPHLAEELFYQLDPKPYTLDPNFGVHQQPWPKYEPKLIKEEMVTVVVQVDGKLRGKIEVQTSKCKVQSEVESLAKEEENAARYLAGKKIKKVVFVPGRLINFVTY